MLDHYYQVETQDGTAQNFETFEEAVEYAEAHDIDAIYALESCDVFHKCWFCEEWNLVDKRSGLCDRCRDALWSRGEEI